MQTSPDSANFYVLAHCRHVNKKFILDAHLGKLARYMRMLGFDAAFNTSLDDEQIIQISLDEHRSILSKDKALLLDKRVINGYFVIATNLKEQLVEVIRHFDLHREINPFTRCLDCDGEILSVDKKEVEEEIPVSALSYYENYTRCKNCKKVFWEGSHQQKMKNFIRELRITLGKSHSS